MIWTGNCVIILAVGYNEAELHFFLSRTPSYAYFLTNSTRKPNISTKMVCEKNSGFAPLKR